MPSTHFWKRAQPPHAAKACPPTRSTSVWSKSFCPLLVLGNTMVDTPSSMPQHTCTIPNKKMFPLQCPRQAQEWILVSLTESENRPRIGEVNYVNRRGGETNFGVVRVERVEPKAHCETHGSLSDLARWAFVSVHHKRRFIRLGVVHKSHVTWWGASVCVSRKKLCDSLRA